MAQAAGKRKTRAPPFPSVFVYDLCHPSQARNFHQFTLRLPVMPQCGPSDLQLPNLQNEKQQFEVLLLELDAQSRAQPLTSPNLAKP